MKPGVVVMTGGTSGLGLVAAQRLIEAGATLWMACRGEAPPGAVGLPADLSRLDDVRAFADAVEARLGDGAIAGLVLNAGGFGGPRTAEGFEGTFALNYLAPYVLTERLWPRLAPGARVVLTTSGTHDPAEGSRIPSPRHADALRLARPETDPERDADPQTAAVRAYASAKLCVVLRARALAARGERGIRVLAYDPGPTPGTGLGRGMKGAFRVMWQRFPWLVRWMMRDKANTVGDAGRTLADLALGVADIPDDAVYVALRAGVLTAPPLSVHARQDALVQALERDSAALLAPA